MTAQQILELERNCNKSINSIFKLRIKDVCEKYSFITEQELKELVDAGYAPCIKDKNGEPRFSTDWGAGHLNIKAYLYTNFFTYQGGHNVPGKFRIFNYEECVPQNIPKKLLSITNLYQYNFDGYPPAVYFLCKEGEVVYVGQTVSMAGRMESHIRDNKQFDSVFFIPVPRSILSNVEKAFIKLLKPILNRENYKSNLNTEEEFNLIKEIGQEEFLSILQKTSGTPAHC